MRASIEPTSRCVVGSSMSKRFGGSSNNLTRASRDFSPPLKTATVLKTSSPRSKKEPSTVRAVCSDTGLGISRALSRTVWLALSTSIRFCEFFHAVDLFQLALCLRCIACLGTKSIGKQLQRRDFFLLIFISGKLLFFARCFLLDITVPVAPVTHQFRVRDLDDAADKLIQKFAVVRDHDNRARITSQIFLEPLKRFEIEMIRRFVEQKEVGFHHEQAREMSAHNPAAT